MPSQLEKEPGPFLRTLEVDNPTTEHGIPRIWRPVPCRATSSLCSVCPRPPVPNLQKRSLFLVLLNTDCKISINMVSISTKQKGMMKFVVFYDLITDTCDATD